MNAVAGASWFASHTEGAPGALRARAGAYVDRVEGALPDRLDRAARMALHQALEAGAGRPAALDLLAADALITLALLAQAEADPASLGKCARAMREAVEPEA